MRKRKLSSILASKRGNAVVDTVMVIIVLFLFGFFIVMGKILFTDIDTGLGNTFSEDAETNVSNQIWIDTRDSYSSTMDSAFVVVFIALWLLVIVASFMIDAHPIFFVISLSLLIIVFLGAAMVSNMWDDFSVTSDKATAAISTMPMTDFIMDNLLIFMIFVGASIALVLFGKQQAT